LVRRPMSLQVRPVLLMVAAGLAACDRGATGGPPAPADRPAGALEGPSCDGIRPGASPIRRMTRFEYDNTVRDLLGDDSAPAKGFVVEEESLGFDNQATALGVTQLLAEEYMQAAEELAATAVANPSKLLGACVPADQGEDACGRSFIAAFGKRAFRRPIA